ncbi:hypothetical protein C8F04DRAFT_1121174 [Mycena alexandri]|uniref:Uncharacterized protein n=1 Tax=Mycena alexandri TaxID=1745969 RepID=A0AAD6SH31_9AGAR|nr:hypothetical protein C8F04DRAFT_1121174 [Mycena alexandri]
MAILNVTIDDASPLISYTGNWSQNVSKEAYGSGYSYTYDQNASATVRFQGTRIMVNGSMYTSNGPYTVNLDGQDHHFNGYSSNFTSFRHSIFSRDDLSPGLHNLTISNDGWETLDIDSITWSCGLGGANDTGSTVLTDQVDDTDSAFAYAPKGSWNLHPPNITMFSEQTGHSTSRSGASVNYTFSGDAAVTIYGTTGPGHSRYSVRRPDQATPRHFTAARDMFSSQVVLYFGAGFGPGNHTITLTTESPGLFQIDYAVAHTAPSTLATNKPIPSPVIPPDPNLSAHKRLSAGVIVTITFAALLFVFLILAVLFLLQRNKTLWYRLQRGYKVQSQYDAGSPPNGTITPLPYSAPPPPMRSKAEYFDANDDSLEAQPLDRATTMQSYLTASTLVADAGSFMSRHRPFSLKALRLSSRWGGSSPATSQANLSQQSPSLRPLTLSAHHGSLLPSRHDSLSPSTRHLSRSPSVQHLLREESQYYREESHYYDPYAASMSGLEEVLEEQVDDVLRHSIRRNEPSTHQQWDEILP